MNPNDPNNNMQPAPDPQLTPQPVQPQATSPQEQPASPSSQSVAPAPFPVADQAAPAVPTPQPTPAQPQPLDQPAASAPVNPFAQQVSNPAPSQQPPTYSEQPPIFGGQMPAPQSISPRQPLNKRLITLIIAAIGVLVVIGAAIWALMTFVVGAVPLETYEGEGYSISAPRDYEEKALGATAVSFVKSQEEGAEAIDDRSTVTVSRLQFSTFDAFMSRDEVIKMYGSDSLNEETIKESLEEGSEIRNFTEDSDQHQGFDARRVSFDVIKDGKKFSTMTMMSVFTEDSVYSILVAANDDDPALARVAGRITNSLKIDE